MRGMDYVVRLRESGYCPAHVILDTKPYNAETLPDWLQIEPHDIPSLTDLRPLVGLTVSVALPTPAECDRWAEAVLAAGAQTVLVSPHQGEPQIRRLGGVDQ